MQGERSLKRMNNCLIDLKIRIKTSNNFSGIFECWDVDALASLGLTKESLDPSHWTYDIRPDLYTVPGVARKGHETGGSVNVHAVTLGTNEDVEFSHIFYVDTGHKGGRGLPHWNHELWIKMGDGKWEPFRKDKTKFHEVPISSSIMIEVADSTGHVESETVHQNYIVTF